VTVIAGVDVGNATTEVVLVSGGKILGAARVPTRGRKGSADSLRGAAALVRRVERQTGCTADEARIAPLRAVDTSVVTVPDTAPPSGRLRVLAAGVPTPGGTGACVGPPLILSSAADFEPSTADPGPSNSVLVAVVPSGLRYDEAAARLRALLAAGTRIGAVLVASDEGVLVANRLPAELPVIDQVDAAAAAACQLLAVEARPPGHTLTLLADPVALGARLGLSDQEAGDAATACRALADHANAVVGLFAVDLAAAAEAATARQGSTGRAVLVASLSRAHQVTPEAGLLEDLLAVPVRSPVTEPAAARLGALTTPGARADAVVVDLGAGTIDVIGGDVTSPAASAAAAGVTGPGASVVAAGAGELLTAAVAEMLGIPRATADWVKRGPCVRVDGGQRFEAEDGTRGFLAASAPVSAAGMLAADGPGGLLPFDRHHGPGEWRAIRLRLKSAVLASNFRRAVRTLGQDPGQVLVVGGPAGDEELLGVIVRSLPDGVAVGRGNVGGTSPGEPLGHRYAVALGLALTS
jgi:hypothetical protein